MKLVELLTQRNLVISHAEGRRTISLGIVSINDEKVNDVDAEIDIKEGDLLSFGKQHIVLK